MDKTLSDVCINGSEAEKIIEQLSNDSIIDRAIRRGIENNVEEVTVEMLQEAISKLYKNKDRTNG